MNRIIVVSCLSLLFVAIEIASAQVASDYYFPLRVGSSWVYHTPGNSTGWLPRRVHKAIQGMDTIAGTQYYRLRGVEIPDANPSDSILYQVLWLRPDSIGNILIGAFSDHSTDVNSASRWVPPLPYFPNQFLTAGYSRVRLDSTRKINYKDSVMSTTETVSVGGWTFTNCLKIRERKKDSLGVTTLVEVAFYARNVGEVKRVREIPTNEAFTNELIQYNIVTSVEEMGTETIPEKMTLRQNYPNPFNPSTSFEFTVSRQTDGGQASFQFVSIKVYDVLGQEVAVLVNEERSPGVYKLTWDAKGLPSGVYLYRMRTGGFTQTRRMALLK